MHSALALALIPAAAFKIPITTSDEKTRRSLISSSRLHFTQDSKVRKRKKNFKSKSQIWIEIVLLLRILLKVQKGPAP